jgi:NhaP-type Na+/H+ or K+/H+ antiporter
MEVLLLLGAVTLLISVFASGIAQRSIISTAVVFLVAGFVAGPGVLDVTKVSPDDPLVIGTATLALYSVLFTDGMRAGVSDLRRAWKLPGRALILGMPLTFGGASLVAHYLAGLSWLQAALVGAVLAPTDPVFAAAIVGREEVPRRLRHLLNVESGLNDGLALPAVLILLAVVATGRHTSTLRVLAELALGVVIGIVVPYVALKLEALPFFRAAGRYQPLNAFAVGVLVFGLCEVTGANEFLAAFAAGSTVASVSPAARSSFEGFGELVTELLKLAAILVFGVLIAPHMFTDEPGATWGFALLLLFAVRPLAIGISLFRGGLDRKELGAAAWFGPKGFASVTYGLLVVQSMAPGADRMFRLIAVAIAVSIVLHSSSDIVVARAFHDERENPHRPVRRLLARTGWGGAGPASSSSEAPAEKPAAGEESPADEQDLREAAKPPES